MMSSFFGGFCNPTYYCVPATLQKREVTPWIFWFPNSWGAVQIHVLPAVVILELCIWKRHAVISLPWHVHGDVIGRYSYISYHSSRLSLSQSWICHWSARAWQPTSENRCFYAYQSSFYCLGIRIFRDVADIHSNKSGLVSHELSLHVFSIFWPGNKRLRRRSWRCCTGAYRCLTSCYNEVL